MSEAAARDPGSFRDPKGHVFSHGDDIFRTVTAAGVEAYELARDSGLLRKLEACGDLVPGLEIEPRFATALGLDAPHVLRHPRLPFISYPYEWTFSALKDAALLHLEVILSGLDHGISLSDATAYNVQFNGWRPQFIDVLSFQRYADGEPWYAYRQFCEQFLNPLLLTALFGVPHHAWYRGNLEGIPTAELASLMRLRHRFNWRILSHVLLQARFQQKSRSDPARSGASARAVRLSRSGYSAIVTQLHNWISGMRPAGGTGSVWSDYADANTYAETEYAAKRKAIAEFCEKRKPAMLWDIGCNSGDFSETALHAGAGFAVGFDADHEALDKAYARAKRDKLAFIPLYQDLANPSPGQGWSACERRGMQERRGADAVLALAIIHHLAIGRNVPLPDAVRWLVSLAPDGIVEFVPKSDPTVQTMLMVRDDIFDSYTEETFASALQQVATIVESRRISATGRTLYIYRRRETVSERSQ